MKVVAEKLRNAEIPCELPIIVEVENLYEIEELSGLRVDLVILDNFNIDAVEQAVKRFGSEFVLEVSGGVGIEDLPALASAGVKRISTSSTIMKAVSTSFKLEVN
jgi:nicotinate-nucleotide pyrophosphorylase (carboxylating)